jgi:urease accessory protein
MLEPTISHQVERLRAAPFDTIGAASLMVDWCTMKHETQETRLFRS